MKFKFLIMVCCISMLIFGCTTTRSSNVNILENNGTAKNGNYVDSLWINKDKIGKNASFKILLAEVNIDNISDEKGITKEECKNILSEMILNSPSNHNILLEKDPSPDYRMKLAITNMSPGDRASRAWAGELGFGHAIVELQAIITNGQNERVIEMKDSHRNSGLIGIRDTFTDSGPQLVKELLQQTSEDILKELNAIKNSLSTDRGDK